MNSTPTAIIGFGRAGQLIHSPLIRKTEGLELVAVSTSRADQVPGGVRIVLPDEIIGDPQIGLVVIASTNTSHFPFALAALQAGQHVVVEKPFCTTTAEAGQLIEAARASRGTLSVFHNRRWDSDFLTARKLLGSAMLGEIALYEAHWDRLRPNVEGRWREQPSPGAGILFDLGPHLIDQALVLFGQPDAVSADVAAQRKGAEVDDYFELVLHYDRMRVILSASMLVASPRPRFGVHGTSGSFVKHGLDPQEDQLKAGMEPDDERFGLEDSSLYGTLTSADGSSRRIPSERGSWIDFYRGVAAAIAGHAPPPVPPEDALAGLRIIELAQASSSEGRRLSVV